MTTATAQRFYRKVIEISAEDSPNVRYARAELRLGRTPSGKVLTPGVLTWDELQMRLATWDPIRQCVGLYGKFYKGAEILMFPPLWLNASHAAHEALRGKPRKAKGLGCDPAEGGDSSAWSVVDELGLIELLSIKTPDTNVIPRITIELGRRHGVDPKDWVFDRGGGGKQHADALRGMKTAEAPHGYPVRTVAFGESLVLEPKYGRRLVGEQKEIREEKTVYKNRRAEMYGKLRELLDPARWERGLATFAIDAKELELRRQLAPIPLTYDEEGRLELLPKNRKDKDDTRPCLTKLIGHSPDEADSLVLAIHGMLNKSVKRLGAF